MKHGIGFGRRVRGGLVAIAIAGALGACDHINLNGATQTIADIHAVDRVDLFQELVPETYSLSPVDTATLEKCRTTADAKSSEGKSKSDHEVRECINVAYRAFESVSTDKEGRRNRLFTHLIAASETACSVFEQNLNTLQSDFNFYSGIATTGLAGAGAIVTGASTARALAGLAGIGSGTRAEFNADWFYQHAAGLIVKAIDGQRATLRNQFGADMARTYDDFPVGLAVAEAIRYNHTCSLVEGLLLADTQLTLAQNPGFDMLMQQIPKANLVRNMLDNKMLPSQAATEIAVALNASGAGNGIGSSSKPSTQTLAAAVGTVAQENTTASIALTAVETAYWSLLPTPPGTKPSAALATPFFVAVSTGLQGFQATASAIDGASIKANAMLAAANAQADPIKADLDTTYLKNAQAAAAACNATINGYVALVVNLLQEIEAEAKPINDAVTKKNGPDATLTPTVTKLVPSWLSLLTPPALPAPPTCAAPPPAPTNG